ncbi:MAG: hypothetical protein H7844_08250 [Nitrospirae bacterium YQR-1]
MLSLSRFNETLGNINKVVDRVYNSAAMGSEEKRRTIDQLRLRSDEITKRGNELIKKSTDLRKKAALAG